MRVVRFIFALPVKPLLMLLVCGCATMGPMNFYSMNDDVQLGSQVIEETRKSMQQQGVPRNKDPKTVQKIRTMVSRIAAVSDHPELPYEVDVYSSDVVNAMAAPGGKIIVFEGLWHPQRGLCRDDDEIAAVIAHEIAHVNCRHSTEQLSRNMLYGGALAVGAAIAKAKDYDKAAYVLGGAFIAYEGLIVTKFSRTDEYEADRVGMMYMAKAGYDPRAAVRIWQRASQGGGRSGSPLDMLSTHPNDAERMRALEAQLPAALAVYGGR
jgi:metalloendopeptidase OMA1, mitochondrial